MKKTPAVTLARDPEISVFDDYTDHSASERT